MSSFVSKLLFGVSMLAMSYCNSVHALPQFQIWTPQSNRPIMTTDLTYARNALQTLQNTLKGFRNGLEGRTYVTGYLPNHMDNKYLMNNAQLFVEASRWQSARKKIDELDTLLSSNQTNGVQSAVDAISHILEEGKRDIDERLTTIAINSKMDRRGRFVGTSIPSAYHLQHIHQAYQQRKARLEAQKNARQEALNGGPAQQQQQPMPQPQPSDNPDEQFRKQLLTAGLTSSQIDELFDLLAELHQNNSEETFNKIIEFIKKLPEAQREAVLSHLGRLGTQIKEILKQSSNGFIDMIKAHPWMTGGLALVAGAAITWALLRSDDPGTLFGQKIKDAFNWIKSWFTGNNNGNNGNNNNGNNNNNNNGQNPPPQPNPNPAPQPAPAPQPQPVPQPNPQPVPQPAPQPQPVPNPGDARPDEGTGQHANNNEVPKQQQQQVPQPDQQQVVQPQRAPNAGHNQRQRYPVQPKPEQRRPNNQQPPKPMEQPVNDNNAPAPVQQQPQQQVPAQQQQQGWGSWLKNKWNQVTTSVQNRLTPELDAAFKLDNL